MECIFIACLKRCSACEIERRPRGASRINPLLHLLQRGHACEAMVVSRFARLKTCAKAGNHGVTGSARCNKCRSGFTRDAPRGRRSISQATNNQRRTPRALNQITRPALIRQRPLRQRPVSPFARLVQGEMPGSEEELWRHASLRSLATKIPRQGEVRTVLTGLLFEPHGQ